MSRLVLPCKQVDAPPVLRWGPKRCEAVSLLLLLGHGLGGGDELPDQDRQGGGPAHLLLHPQLLRGPGQLVRHHGEGGGEQGLGEGRGVQGESCAKELSCANVGTVDREAAVMSGGRCSNSTVLRTQSVPCGGGSGAVQEEEGAL